MLSCIFFWSFDLFFHLGYIYFLSWHICYNVRGGTWGVCWGGGQPMLLSCGTVCGGGVQEGTMLLAQLMPSFQLLLLLPTSKLGSSSADFQVSGFVYILGSCGSFQWTLLWGWEFLLLPQPPQVFSVRGFGALFPRTGTLGCGVCLAPQLFLLIYPPTNVGPRTLLMWRRPMWYLEDGTAEQAKLVYSLMFQETVLQMGFQSETYCADKQSSI